MWTFRPGGESWGLDPALHAGQAPKARRWCGTMILGSGEHWGSAELGEGRPQAYPTDLTGAGHSLYHSLASREHSQNQSLELTGIILVTILGVGLLEKVIEVVESARGPFSPFDHGGQSCCSLDEIR